MGSGRLIGSISDFLSCYAMDDADKVIDDVEHAEVKNISFQTETTQQPKTSIRVNSVHHALDTHKQDDNDDHFENNECSSGAFKTKSTIILIRDSTYSLVELPTFLSPSCSITTLCRCRRCRSTRQG